MASKIKVDQIEGSTGSTITIPTGQTFTVTDGIPVASGGTGLASFTAGDILYATGATTLTKLGKGTAEQVLAMNTGATAPDWGSVDLTVLPTITVAKGGTNIASFTAGDILYATGATTLAKLAKGSGSDTLKMNSGATAPEWVTVGAASSDFVKLTSDSTNTGASSYSFDHFENATYSNYMVIVDRWTSNSDGAGVNIRFRNASGDLSGSYYKGCHYGRTFASGSESDKTEKIWGGDTMTTFGWGCSDSVANLANKPAYGVLWFGNITSSSMPTYQANTTSWDGPNAMRDVTSHNIYENLEDTRGFTIYTGGTFSIGTVTTYGIKT